MRTQRAMEPYIARSMAPARCSLFCCGICSAEGSKDKERGQLGGLNASSHGTVGGEHRLAHCRIQVDLVRDPRSYSADPPANGQGHPTQPQRTMRRIEGVQVT